MQRVTALLIAAVCFLLAGSAGGSVFALSTVTMYPDFNVAPSSDTGCTALTTGVSSSTGGLDSSAPPGPMTGNEIDQEDTSYNAGAGGASFCSYDYTGTSFSLTSATATLFLAETGPNTDSWPVTVSLIDLTSCTTYTPESPCPTVATGSDTVTGVPAWLFEVANGCANAAPFSITLTPSLSASLTNGHLYGLVVSALSNEGNGFSGLILCTGSGVAAAADPTMVSVSGGTSPVNGVPQFPYGLTVILGVGMVGLMFLARRDSIKSSTPNTSS
jgi:hypothetical protein